MHSRYDINVKIGGLVYDPVQCEMAQLDPTFRREFVVQSLLFFIRRSRFGESMAFSEREDEGHLALSFGCRLILGNRN